MTPKTPERQVPPRMEEELARLQQITDAGGNEDPHPPVINYQVEPEPEEEE